MVLSPPGSPFTAHLQLKPFVTPSLNPDNHTIAKLSLLFWCHLKQDHTSSLDNWRLSVCIPEPLTWFKTYFQMPKSLTLAWEKNLNFYREWPAVTPGLDHSQRNCEALAWLDCATTLGKGFVYPGTPPALPKHCTSPWASGHRLLEIGFRLAGDQQGPRSALCKLTWTPAYQPGTKLSQDLSWTHLCQLWAKFTPSFTPCFPKKGRTDH